MTSCWRHRPRGHVSLPRPAGSLGSAPVGWSVTLPRPARRAGARASSPSPSCSSTSPAASRSTTSPCSSRTRAWGRSCARPKLQGVRRRSLPSPSALRRYLESFQGGAAGAWTGLHPRARRRPARPGEGQRRAHALPAAPGAADAGHARHGRHCGGDAEADGALQLTWSDRLSSSSGGGRGDPAPERGEMDERGRCFDDVSL